MQQHQHVGGVNPHVDPAPDLFDSFFNRTRGGERKHRQDQECECPRDDESTEREGFQNHWKVHTVYQHCEYQHVRRCSAESIQSESFALGDDDRPAGYGAQRGDGERKKEKKERNVTCL